MKFIFATTEPPEATTTPPHAPLPLPAGAARAPRATSKQPLRRRRRHPTGPGALSWWRAGGGSVRDSLSAGCKLMAGSDERGLTYDLAVALLGYTHAACWTTSFSTPSPPGTPPRVLLRGPRDPDW
ncbi:hypothetical protein QJS66_17040 [Kocuria rhizophila]|nr:hypothetical protein QJS66_17040 [Kocuria rhizophila]